MMRRQALGRTAWLLAAGASSAVLLLSAGVAPRPASSVATGCGAGAPVEPFHGDGSPASAPPALAPRACAGTTGYGGAETRIVVTSDGTLVYEPAIVTPGLLGTGYLSGAPGPQPSTQVSPGGLAVSSDLGGTWRFVEPAGQTWVPQDDQLFADRSTGWLYYYALSPDPVPQSGTPVQSQLPAGYAQLLASPDDGRSWYHTALAGFVESENPRFAAAPARPGQPGPVAYAPHPDVVYWCGNNTLFVERYRACYRSLDGGVTWQYRSLLLSNPVPQHPQCGTSGESFSAGDGDYPEGAPDGSLYVLVTCGGRTLLARSTDEGATWPVLTDPVTGAPRTTPGDGELRVGPSGALYLVVQKGDALGLWTSIDAGTHWLGPQDMTAPGVKGVIQWAMAEAGSGHVAVSYLAAAGSTGGYDGWTTVTTDALDTDPLFWAARISDPDSPGMPLESGTPPAARDDFIGVDIGPDGTTWASFFASCRAADPDPACQGQSGDPEAAKAVVASLSGLR